jgi:CubicO group peptidase (beta-lactamase class C family)
VFAHVLRYMALTALLTISAIPVVDGALAQNAPSTHDYWPTLGWRTAPAEQHGIDPGMLAWADQRLQAEAPLLSSIVVVKDGYIVFERNYNGYSLDQRPHIWSVNKSVTNIAVGFALQEGIIGSLEQTLGDLIPYRIPADADPRVWNVTIEQLLTMTSGWAWDGRINFSRTHETDDIDAMLRRPMQCDPGTCFEYDSGCSNLLAFVIEELTGQTMEDYLQPRLFEPLGIAQPYWVVTEDDTNRGGGGLHLNTREMAKIGYLYLNGGQWDGRQIISRKWVERSTHTQSSGVGFLSGVNIGHGPYGYHWWIQEPAGWPAFSAQGYGGQLIYVVPGLDLVVTTLFVGADPVAPEQQQRPIPIIEEVIVPAAIASEPSGGDPAATTCC